MSLARRFVGVLFTPRSTYRAIVAAPTSGGVLALVALVVAGSLLAFLSTEVGQGAYVDQRIRSVEAFGGEVSDADYARLRSASRSVAPRLAASVLVGVPIAATALAGGVVVASRVGRSPTIRMPQALAVVAHSGLVLALWRIVAGPLDYGRQSMSGSTSLGSFASFVDDTSPIARLLGTIDVVVVWWLVSLAVGVSVVLERRAGPVVVTFLSAYGAVAVALMIIAAIFGTTSR